MNNQNIVVAIDVGTTKILVIVSEIDRETEKFKILGYGMSASNGGLSKGRVVDIDRASKDIEAAIKAAEIMSSVPITKAFVGIAGKHIESLESSGIITLSENEPREITKIDRKRLEDIAENKVVPVERTVIHRIGYNYRIDNSGIIKNPVGMKGCKLEGTVHIVTGLINTIDALIKSVNKLSIEVEDVVLEPYASGKAVLTDTEKRTGVILVDIGGGTTDIAVFKNEKLIYTSVLPLGGEHFTYDIATVLGIETRMADNLKKDFSINNEDYKIDEIVEIPNYDRYTEKKEIEIGYLKEIIDSRIEDILENIEKKIEASGVQHQVYNGIVFTGGSSKIAGLKERAEKYFDMPVRFAVPIKRDGLSEQMLKPEDATGVGLLLYGVEKSLEGEVISLNKEESEGKRSMFEVIVEKLKKGFDIFFSDSE